MSLIIRVFVIFLMFNISANALTSNKQYKSLKKELKEIKRMVKILEKRTRPKKPKKVAKTKSIDKLYNNRVGYEFDCQRVQLKQTKIAVVPEYEIQCLHTPIIRLKSKYGQEISFLGKSFETPNNLKQTLSLKEDNANNLYVNSFISLSYIEPYTIGLGVTARKTFNKHKHQFEILIAQYSFLTRAKDSGEFFRDYDFKYLYHASKRAYIAIRPFIRQKSYSKSRLFDTYSMRLYIGAMYYFGSKYNYVVELSPFYERLYNPKATKDGYEVDYENLKPLSKKTPDSNELGGYSNSFGLHGSFTYRW